MAVRKQLAEVCAVRMLVLLWTCIVAVGFGGGFLSADEEEPAAGNLKRSVV